MHRKYKSTTVQTHKHTIAISKQKTIQIFDELKVAKRHCNKDQKVIKVPNTNVFKITAAFLLNKGISRIVSSDNLIAL